MTTQSGSRAYPELFLPHLGWLVHQPGDAVALYLNQGWFEYKEQALAWLYLREGDVVLDCGAHFGLYAVLAGGVAGRGLVLAVEANPAALPVLRQNLERHGVAGARVIAKAVAGHTGEADFYPADAAAYSSLVPGTGAAAPVRVAATTLDDLLAEHRLARVDFAKIDVEGAEPEVWRGAARSLAEGRFSLIMIEFTEENLRRAGSSTGELWRQIESAGYSLCRFDPQRCRLEPQSCAGPVWYENLFATRQLEQVNQRLANAPAERMRIAGQILERGRAAEDLYRRAEDARHEIEQARRNEHDAYHRLGEADWRAGEARKEADQAYARLGEANWRLEDALRQLEAARGELAESRNQCLQAGRELQHVAEQVRPYLRSRYVRFGWKLGLIRKPEWLMRFVSGKRGAGNA